MPGIPVVISDNGFGIAVKQVDSGAVVMTVATNGLGIPIVLTDAGMPAVVEGSTRVALSGSHTLSEDDPIGTIVGALTVVNPPDGDPTGWTFEITSDPDSKFEIEDLANNLLLETGDALLLETGDLLLLEA